MEHNIKPVKALAFFVMAFAFFFSAHAQSTDINKTLRDRYNSFPKHEVSFQRFSEVNTHVYSVQPLAFYNGCGLGTNSICGNGDFEGGLDPAEWQGAYSTWGSGDPDPFTFTEGIISGDIFDFNAHQTVVSAGVDPITGISTVPSNGGAQSLRLGNAVNSYGTELIGKKIIVTNAQTIIKFAYAVVFQDPNHAPEDQPSMAVRVYDCATGLELTGVCDLGNGSNKVVSDAENPFFESLNSGTIAYRDWSTAQINLSQYVGKTVNIMFINKDCGLGGHYGYTYIDNFCANEVIGPYSINLDKSDSCGIGKICTVYELPSKNGLTGDLAIDLDIYQNGAKVTTITSPTLTSGTAYCFSINPATLGIDQSLGGFDYAVTGRFSIDGSILAPLTLGNPPDGQAAGSNNDYKVSCSSVGGSCVSGTNLVKNPGFEEGNKKFNSEYKYQPAIAAASVKPGQYTVGTSAQALIINPAWKVDCASDGKHLIVNGITGGTKKKYVWHQDINVEYNKPYTFCVNLKNLPSGTSSDIKPKVMIRLSIGNTIIASSTKVIDVADGSCNWDVMSLDFVVPGTLKSTASLYSCIFLLENGTGDGNDLAVDNINLVAAPASMQNIASNASVANASKISTDKKIMVYPNPAKDNLTVTFPQITDQSKLVIYNINGTKVKEITLKPGESRVDINTTGLAPGTYVAKLFSAVNKMDGYKIFIKQ